MKDYGISDQGVLLGDGVTGVQSMGFKDGSAGVVFCRDGRHIEPYSLFAAGENDTDMHGDNPILVVRADNEKSIQVVIDRLEEAKSLINSWDNEC